MYTIALIHSSLQGPEHILSCLSNIAAIQLKKSMYSRDVHWNNPRANSRIVGRILNIFVACDFLDFLLALCLVVIAILEED